MKLVKPFGKRQSVSGHNVRLHVYSFWCVESYPRVIEKQPLYFYVIQTFKLLELLYATAFPSSDGL